MMFMQIHQLNIDGDGYDDGGDWWRVWQTVSHKQWAEQENKKNIIDTILSAVPLFALEEFRYHPDKWEKHKCWSPVSGSAWKDKKPA